MPPSLLGSTLTFRSTPFGWPHSCSCLQLPPPRLTWWLANQYLHSAQTFLSPTPYRSLSSSTSNSHSPTYCLIFISKYENAASSLLPPTKVTHSFQIRQNQKPKNHHHPLLAFLPHIKLVVKSCLLYLLCWIHFSKHRKGLLWCDTIFHRTFTLSVFTSTGFFSDEIAVAWPLHLPRVTFLPGVLFVTAAWWAF